MIFIHPKFIRCFYKIMIFCHLYQLRCQIANCIQIELCITSYPNCSSILICHFIRCQLINIPQQLLNWIITCIVIISHGPFQL